MAYDDEDLIPEPGQLFDGGGSKEDFVRLGYNWVANMLIGRGQLKPTEDVLDLGSGNGAKARPLVRYLTTGTYTGLDVVREGVEWCQERYTRCPNFRFVWADVQSDWYNKAGPVTADRYVLPFEDASFDVVFMVSLATHLLPAELENYLRQTARVLRPGGRAIMTVFLINQQSVKFETAVQEQRFKLVDNNHAVIDLQNPRRGVAHAEVQVRRMALDAGLRLAETYYGSWGGGCDLTGGWQDTMIMVRPRD